MNRYVLRRETVTGANTVKTTNPSEVERWLWESLSQGSTLSVTVKVEDVPRPEPKAKPQCEGQRTIMDEMTQSLVGAPGPNLDSYVVTLEGVTRAHDRLATAPRWCQFCGFSQCPKVGARPAGCALR